MTIKREIFDNFLENYVNQHSHIKSSEDFIHEISRLSILIIDEHEVKFLHKSFLDYFIAKYFIQESDEMTIEQSNEIYKNYYSALWEDVTNFYFGIKSKISKVQIDKILGFAPCHNVTNVEGKEIELSTCDIQNSSLIESLYIFQLSKLMQYAWNTKNENKSYALSISTLESISLKKKLIQFQDKELGMKLPSIAADASMIHFIDLCYSSVFLEKQIDGFIIDTITKLPEISISEFRDDESYQSKFYFCNLYIMINSNRLSLTTVEKFTTILIENEEKIPPHLSLVVFGLFSIFKDKKTISIDKSDIEKINLISKKLVKKYNILAREIFQFKNQISKNKINSLKK